MTFEAWGFLESHLDHSPKYSLPKLTGRKREVRPGWLRHSKEFCDFWSRGKKERGGSMQSPGERGSDSCSTTFHIRKSAYHSILKTHWTKAHPWAWPAILFHSYFILLFWGSVPLALLTSNLLCSPGWTWSCYIAQAGLELLTLLSPPSECWDCRQSPIWLYIPVKFWKQHS